MGVEWDANLPGDIAREFKLLQDDFFQLNSIAVPRKALSGRISLYVFTDASVSIYGFSCYCRYAEGGEAFTQLLFSKVKNAPKPEKTMPTLELLAVVLALKCLPSILEAVDVSLVDDVFVGIDAQVVLSWILSGKVNNKNNQ